jgi:hypothetical protein
MGKPLAGCVNRSPRGAVSPMGSRESAGFSMTRHLDRKG